MKHLIWFNPQTQMYHFGSQEEFTISQSLVDETFDILYELTNTEHSAAEKIVVQLNKIRRNQNVRKEI